MNIKDLLKSRTEENLKNNPSDYLRDYFESLLLRKAIYVLNLPTGSGKTHHTFHLINNKGRNHYPFCFYVVPQRKQRDNGYEEYKHSIKKYNIDEKEALLLNNIVDQAELSYKNNLYNDLKLELKQIQEQTNSKITKTIIDDSLNILDNLMSMLDFRERNPFIKELKDNFSSNDAIRNCDSLLRWQLKKVLVEILGPKLCSLPVELEELDNNMQLCFNIFPSLRLIYPWMEIYRKKTILCTAKKYLQKLPMLVNPDIIFFKSEFLRGSLVILDESDAVYQDWRDELLSNPSARTVYSLYHVFNRLCDAFAAAQGNMPTDYDCREDLEKIILNTLARKEKLFQDSNIRHNLEIYTKAEISKQRYCMFHSDDIRYLLSTGGKQMNIRLNEEDNIHNLEPFDGNVSDMNEDTAIHDNIVSANVYHVAREMVNIMQYVSVMLADVIRKQVDKKRQKIKDRVVVVDKEESDVYRKVHLDGGMRYIADILKRMSSAFSNNTNLPMIENSYNHYNRGWMMTQLKFDETVTLDEKFLTDINYLTQNVSAEKILVYMYNRMDMTIALMSATAGSKSLSTNFNLDYLKSELGKGLICIPRKIIRSFEKSMEKYLPDLSERPVNCSSLPLASFKEDKLDLTSKIPEGVENLFPEENKSIGKKFLRELANMISVHFSNMDSKGESSEQYYISQYYNFFFTYKTFIQDSRLRSGLCLCERLPKDRNAENSILWSKDILSQGAALIDGRINKAEDYEFQRLPPNMEENILFISSSNYDKDTDKLKEIWESGKKCMAVSSYKTIGAGMNLAYKIPVGIESTGKKLPYMDGIPDKELKKDIDCISLMDVTGFRKFNMSTQFTKDNKESHLYLYQYITHLLALKYSGYMSHFDVCRELSNVIAYNKSLFNKNYKGFSADLNEYRLYKIIQALGRISRSTIKGKATVILYDPSLSKALAYADDNMSYTFEMRCLIDHIRNEMSNGTVKMMQQKIDKQLLEKLVIVSNNARAGIISHNSVALASYHSISEEVSPYTLQMQKSIDKLKELICRFPTLSDYPDNPEISKHINKYIQFHKESMAYSVVFKDGLDMFSEKIYPDIVVCDKITVVREENTYLPLLMLNESVRKWFQVCGAAEHWVPGKYILAPYLMMSTYKGAIGELAFQGIMKYVFNVELKKIYGPLYELGDWMTENGNILFDIKNFNPENPSFSVERDLMPNLRHKVLKSRKKLIVVNMLYKDDNVLLDDNNPENILFINGLINAKTGKLIPKSVDCLSNVLEYYRTFKSE